MKKTLFLGAFLLVAGATHAQITLTAATHMPAPGTAHYMAFIDTSVNPSMPSTGANQTWNYSGIAPVGYDTVNYFACIPTADCGSFGNANLLMGSPTDTLYQYFKASGNVFQTTGAKDPQFTAKFTNPLDLYRFPLTYNSQFTDAASGTASSPLVPLPLTVSSNDTVRGVGYGTLITPAGTFNDVLLVRTNISFAASALFQPVMETHSVQYEWFEAGSRFPVMTLAFTTTDFSGQTTEDVAGTYRIPTPTGVSTQSGSSAAFHMAPNPATGTTRLEIPESFGQNATVLITDISGKTVFQQNAGTQAFLDINTADWAKGIYFVRVQSASGTTSMQKLSVQ